MRFKKIHLAKSIYIFPIGKSVSGTIEADCWTDGPWVRTRLQKDVEAGMPSLFVEVAIWGGLVAPSEVISDDQSLGTATVPSEVTVNAAELGTNKPDGVQAAGASKLGKFGI